MNNDIWIYISTFLFPEDIVHLRRTNKNMSNIIKTFYKIFDEKSVLTIDNIIKKLVMKTPFSNTKEIYISKEKLILDVDNNLILHHSFILPCYNLDCLYNYCGCIRELLLPGNSRIRLNTYYGSVIIDTDDYRSSLSSYIPVRYAYLPTILHHKNHYWLRYRYMDHIVAIKNWELVIIY